MNRSAAGSVLITDFDGTMTEREFYKLVRERLLPPGVPDYWVDYRAGRMTHFEALRRFFAAAEGGEPALLGVAQDMGLESDLAARVATLHAAGWEAVVVSAGCGWYIDRLLAGAGVTLEVHANPGRIEDGRLIMDFPAESPYLSTETGIEKAAVVRSKLEGGRTVAFAGDGFPDLYAALLAPAHLRFARGDLAEALGQAGERFRPFARWADVVTALAGEPGP